MRLSKARLLVVDDEPALRHLIKKWLMMLGCQDVHVAGDGEAALELLRSRPVDLVLTDVGMPVLDGVGLVHCIAKAGKYLPSIVFLSGYGDVDRRIMHGFGVEAFVAKPFEHSDLQEVLQNALAERSTLWLSAMAIAPRQVMSIHVRRFAEHATPDSICLGRGGFSAVSESPLSLGKVAFQCAFEDGRPQVAGQGYVRWRSRTDLTVGIEFGHLDACCHSWLTRQINESSPKSFIPPD